MSPSVGCATWTPTAPPITAMHRSVGVALMRERRAEPDSIARRACAAAVSARPRADATSRKSQSGRTRASRKWARRRQRRSARPSCLVARRALTIRRRRAGCAWNRHRHDQPLLRAPPSPVPSAPPPAAAATVRVTAAKDRRCPRCDSRHLRECLALPSAWSALSFAWQPAWPRRGQRDRRRAAPLPSARCDASRRGQPESPA